MAATATRRNTRSSACIAMRLYSLSGRGQARSSAWSSARSSWSATRSRPFGTAGRARSADTSAVATEPFALHEAVLDAQARMGQGIVIVDVPSGKIVYANDAVARLTGFPVEEVLELPTFMALSPPSYAMAMEQARVRRLAGSDEPNEWDTVIHRKDGTRLDVEVAVSHVDGEPNLMVAFLRDVTRHKQAERALRESERRLRTLVTRAPVLLWTVNRDGIFTAVEGRSLSELRITADEIVGRSIHDVCRDMPEVFPHYELALRGEVTEATIEASGRTLKAHLVPLEAEDGTVDGVVGVATDITELARAQAQLS